MRKPNEEREIHGGIQKIFRFDNGFGASVVRHLGSYGSNEGLWELAVIKFHGKGNFDFKLDYSTPITDNVLGHLQEDEVEDLLNVIAALKQGE
jgi:hypothetical protein